MWLNRYVLMYILDSLHSNTLQTLSVLGFILEDYALEGKPTLLLWQVKVIGFCGEHNVDGSSIWGRKNKYKQNIMTLVAPSNCSHIHSDFYIPLSVFTYLNDFMRIFLPKALSHSNIHSSNTHFSSSRYSRTKDISLIWSGKMI